jgi:translation initiation factor IF-3
MRFKDDLADLSKVEHHPKMEGRMMIMVLGSEIAK